MITDVIISLVLKIASPLLALLKPISIVVNSEYVSVVLEWVTAILYFFPIDTVNTILALICTTWLIRVVISFLRTIWGILPFV